MCLFFVIVYCEHFNSNFLHLLSLDSVNHAGLDLKLLSKLIDYRFVYFGSVFKCITKTEFLFSSLYFRIKLTDFSYNTHLFRIPVICWPKYFFLNSFYLFQFIEIPILFSLSNSAAWSVFSLTTV